MTTEPHNLEPIRRREDLLAPFVESFKGPGAWRIGPEMEKFGIFEATGTPGRVSMASDALDLGEQLAEGKVQFGVFHGVGFAWAQEKHPTLKPLALEPDVRE